MSALSEPASSPAAAPLDAAAARVEAVGQVLAEALSLRLRGPRVTLVGDASAVLGPLLRRAQVTRGVFRVFNEDVALARAAIAPVPRDPPLPLDLTPLAFVTWGTRLGRGLARRKAAERAAEACERVGLGAGARQPLGRSPLLTRRLTLLAHAAALEPRLIVVEDPLEGLNASDVGFYLRALDRAIGKTHVLVSTVRADATSPGQALARGADEVVLLEGGRVLGQGRPDEVFPGFARTSPATPQPPPASPSAGAAAGPANTVAAPISAAAAPVGARDAEPPPPSAAPAAPAPANQAPASAVLAPVTVPSSVPPPSQRMTRLAPEPPLQVARAVVGDDVSQRMTHLSPELPPEAIEASANLDVSQRMTRLASEPPAALVASTEAVPPSQRTTRLPDPGRPIGGAFFGHSQPKASRVEAPQPPAEPAPLTRRAQGVEPPSSQGQSEESGESSARALGTQGALAAAPPPPAEPDPSPEFAPAPSPEAALTPSPETAVAPGIQAASSPSLEVASAPGTDVTPAPNLEAAPAPSLEAAPSPSTETAPSSSTETEPSLSSEATSTPGTSTGASKEPAEDPAMLLSSADLMSVINVRPPPPPRVIVEAPPPPKPSDGIATATPSAGLEAGPQPVPTDAPNTGVDAGSPSAPEGKRAEGEGPASSPSAKASPQGEAGSDSEKQSP